MNMLTFSSVCLFLIIYFRRRWQAFDVLSKLLCNSTTKDSTDGHWWPLIGNFMLDDYRFYWNVCFHSKWSYPGGGLASYRQWGDLRWSQVKWLNKIKTEKATFTYKITVNCWNRMWSNSGSFGQAGSCIPCFPHAGCCECHATEGQSPDGPWAKPGSYESLGIAAAEEADVNGKEPSPTLKTVAQHSKQCQFGK